jgi:hypothetical protein
VPKAPLIKFKRQIENTRPARAFGAGNRKLRKNETKFKKNLTNHSMKTPQREKINI